VLFFGNYIFKSFSAHKIYMNDKSFIKKLQVTGKHKQYKQLSVGIPDEFAKEYSLKKGDYVVAESTKEGILLKKIDNPEEVILNFCDAISKGDYAPISLKDFDIPYDWDILFPPKYKK